MPVTGGYSATLNPFVYFHSLLDLGDCSANDVPLTELEKDLKKVDDDAELLLHLPQPLQRRGQRPVRRRARPKAPPRPTPSSPQLVPKILASPAYKKDGLLIVTFGQANPAPIDRATGAPVAARPEPAESRRAAGLAFLAARLAPTPSPTTPTRCCARPRTSSASPTSPRPAAAKVKSFAPAAAGRKTAATEPAGPEAHAASRFLAGWAHARAEQTGEPITAAGIEELKAELAELEGPARQEMAARIKTAREEGDLKENAEYHVAKEDQAHMETRIKRLQERLAQRGRGRGRRRPAPTPSPSAAPPKCSTRAKARPTPGPWSARPRPTSPRAGSRPSRRSAGP